MVDPVHSTACLVTRLLTFRAFEIYAGGFQQFQHIQTLVSLGDVIMYHSK